jgi:hypothetical protein
MKHIITSGCSFTRQWRRPGISGDEYDFMKDIVSQHKWPHFIQKEYPNYKVINYGNPTNDNSVIVDSTIYGITKLLKENIKPEDIKVIVQWSGWSRSSFFISKEKQIENPLYYLNKDYVKKLHKNFEEKVQHFAHVNDFINEEKKYIGEHGYYILSGGYYGGGAHIKARAIEFFNDFVEHILSAEERMLQYFKSILLLQSFCNERNIDYKCFTMHNNFSFDYTDKDAFPSFGENVDPAYEVVMNKTIPITWDGDLTYNYENKPYLKYLYDLIDFNKFWFYKEEGVTMYGGQSEWAIKKFDIDEISDDKNYPNILWQETIPPTPTSPIMNSQELIEHLRKNNWWQHTSPYLNRKFVREELVDFLGKPIKTII